MRPFSRGAVGAGGTRAGRKSRMMNEEDAWNDEPLADAPLVVAEEVAPEGAGGPAGPEPKYRAINGFAVASLVFGGLSILTVVYWAMAVVPLAGIALAWLAFRRFRKNPEEQTGLMFAKLGLGLSLGLWLFGYSYQLYTYFTAAPPGYKPISYKLLQPDPSIQDERIPPAAEDLDKEKVFIHGYMFRARQRTNMREFVLVDDPGACAFCAPKPKATQLILVKLQGNLRTEFTTHLIGVGGEFTVHKDPREEGMGGLVYKIEADCLR